MNREMSMLIDLSAELRKMRHAYTSHSTVPLVALDFIDQLFYKLNSHTKQSLNKSIKIFKLNERWEVEWPQNVQRLER
jgi:hypothetical protein